MRVPRTCTETPAGDGDRHAHGERRSRPLKEYREAPAYVLVGDPGAGKTTAFETEREALGDQAFLVTARDFLTFDPKDHPEWRGKTLFIDGLDEIRAGTSDVRTPFDQVRGKLDSLGKPRFRLSCREADWLGENDRKHLDSVSPDSEVKVLRLDPLTDADIASILEGRRDIQDAQAFIQEARERGVEGLLENPQTLEMLALAVASRDEWPRSRKETFEMACGQMVREHNDGHQAAQEGRSLPGPNQLLDAAGRLCALQLISGRAGYTLRGEPEDEYPAPDQCDPDNPEVHRSALFANLFKGAASSNRFTPVHRHVAEFLGGRYLAGVIHNRLPARRVISMMTGEDGAVVTELRGLSAWLAAHSRDARADLIERDPIGIGLYGDIGEFSLNEKRALLESLNREGIRLHALGGSAEAFGALATPAMEPVIREILKDGDRGRDHQVFTDFVLRVLKQGIPLADLSELLLRTVRDDTRWPRVTKAALDAFIHCCRQDSSRRLLSLLSDIQAGTVADSDNELLGTLLTQLYPQELPPSEIWGYLAERGNPLLGRYLHFWDTRLIRKSSDRQIAELLDHLHPQLSGLGTALKAHHLSALPLKLLARGLELHGNRLEPARLYDWLSVGILWDEDHQTAWFGAEEIRRVRDWLEQHTESRKAVLTEGLARSLESGRFEAYAFDVRKRLYHANLPPDYGLWCLEQAEAMADARPLVVAESLFEWAVRAHLNQRDNEGLSLEILKAYAARKESFKTTLNRVLASHRLAQPALESTEEQQRQEEEWPAYVRSKETVLLENRADPGLLYRLSEVYFGRFIKYAGDGAEAVGRSLYGDHRLTEAALQGLRGVTDREDLPGVEEILALARKRQVHLLCAPFLAGLEVAERTTPEDSSQWEIGRIRRAIVFYYSTPLENYQPHWYRRLLATRPEIVAEVQVQFAVSAFRGDSGWIAKLWELEHDPGHAWVAKLASLPLLRAFPMRCQLERIEDLKYLLYAAVQHADRASLHDLIGKKLSQKSMNDTQRAYWLAAGIVVAPGVYQDQLREFAQDREDRIRNLMAFFVGSKPEQSSFDELGDPTLELLIRLGGSSVGPDEQWKEGLVTPAMQASRLVNGLIQRLAASPDPEASAALEDLLADRGLSRWQDALSHARDAQRVIRRDAGYRHPNIEQVCQTLNGGTPANAADLAALLMDRLQELARDIRRGNTDGWLQYWNADSHGRPEDPRHEDRCRDALLDALRQRLPERVDAQPEGHYANDKRADIRVSCGDFQVPVEIKKNSHQQLWSALRNQLIDQYTTDPATGGYGIYLVFWFGRKGTPPPPTGPPPATAEELQERLEATLSPVEARKISVCVIDVSRPQPAR